MINLMKFESGLEKSKSGINIWSDHRRLMDEMIVTTIEDSDLIWRRGEKVQQNWTGSVILLKTTSEMYVASLTLLILDFRFSTFRYSTFRYSSFDTRHFDTRVLILNISTLEFRYSTLRYSTFRYSTFRYSNFDTRHFDTRVSILDISIIEFRFATFRYSTF